MRIVMKAKILIIEDEARMRRLLQLMLEDKGFMVKTGRDGVEGIMLWRQWHPDVVLTDLKMPRKDGMEVLDFKNRNKIKTPLIILTAFGSIDSAVDAVKKGAFDYLTKPLMNEQVEEAIQKALDYTERNSRLGAGHSKNEWALTQGSMIGSSVAIEKVREAMERVAQSPTTVLITGESGVGKELVAIGIHTRSNRSKGPFIKINCPAIPKDLLESELFGHRKGAFTGAVKDQIGAFQKADGGTLFLDEIGDLPLTLQPKLLHAVEEKTVSPVGVVGRKFVDVRIIAATNQDLSSMVANFQFRSDLYYRLNAYQIHVPPLRDRVDDIPELCSYFIDHYAQSLERQSPKIRPDGLQQLKQYIWPGNIRELRNIMERCVLNLKGENLTSSDVPTHICQMVKEGGSNTEFNHFDLRAREKQMIIDALEQTGWNQSRAAKMLNVTRNTLRYRLKKFGIQQH